MRSPLISSPSSSPRVFHDQSSPREDHMGRSDKQRLAIEDESKIGRQEPVLSHEVRAEEIAAGNKTSSCLAVEALKVVRNIRKKDQEIISRMEREIKMLRDENTVLRETVGFLSHQIAADQIKCDEQALDYETLVRKLVLKEEERYLSTRRRCNELEKELAEKETIISGLQRRHPGPMSPKSDDETERYLFGTETICGTTAMAHLKHRPTS
mmetsp:Transcript_26835/g.54933  ORF Transcript_26835/g.54933 Transcript_26835/m.54933 type:complete len:211 (-) Transcript_26835:163-795(-)